MKKLLFAAAKLDLGGIEKALVTLVNYLAEEKENDNYRFDITLVLEKKEGFFLDTLNKRIKLVEYTPSTYKFSPIRKLINFIKQMKFKKEYKNKFDFSAAYATYSLPASFVARVASDNSALWVHSEYMGAFHNNLDEYIRFFKRIKIDKFKKIVFVSENASDIFKNIYKKKPNVLKKVEVINNIIDDKTILSKSNVTITDVKKQKEFTFLNVGRHTEYDKRLSRLIKASKKLKDDGYQFRVICIGEGEETKNYKKMVKQNRIRRCNIIFGKKRKSISIF